VTNAAPQSMNTVTESRRQIYLAAEAGDPDAARGAMVSPLESVKPTGQGEQTTHGKGGREDLQDRDDPPR
jgi:DNA-binding FadR family transcriptional regulator